MAMPLGLAAALIQGSVSESLVLAYAIAWGVISAFAIPARDGMLTRVAGTEIQKVVTQATGFQFAAMMCGQAIAGAGRELGASHYSVYTDCNTGVRSMGSFSLARSHASSGRRGSEINGARDCEWFCGVVCNVDNSGSLFAGGWYGRVLHWRNDRADTSHNSRPLQWRRERYRLWLDRFRSRHAHYHCCFDPAWRHPVARPCAWYSACFGIPCAIAYRMEHAAVGAVCVPLRMGPVWRRGDVHVSNNPVGVCAALPSFAGDGSFFPRDYRRGSNRVPHDGAGH